VPAFARRSFLTWAKLVKTAQPPLTVTSHIEASFLSGIRNEPVAGLFFDQSFLVLKIIYPSFLTT
jgi:hypothetical protein